MCGPRHAWHCTPSAVLTNLYICILDAVPPVQWYRGYGRVTVRVRDISPPYLLKFCVPVEKVQGRP